MVDDDTLHGLSLTLAAVSNVRDFSPVTDAGSAAGAMGGCDDGQAERVFGGLLERGGRWLMRSARRPWPPGSEGRRRSSAGSKPSSGMEPEVYGPNTREVSGVAGQGQAAGPRRAEWPRGFVDPDVPGSALGGQCHWQPILMAP